MTRDAFNDDRSKQENMMKKVDVDLQLQGQSAKMERSDAKAALDAMLSDVDPTDAQALEMRKIQMMRKLYSQGTAVADRQAGEV